MAAQATREFDPTHAVELAVIAQLDYTASLVVAGKNRSLYEVPSRDRSRVYSVTHQHSDVDGYRAGWSCECTHYQMRGGECSHIGAGIVHEICQRKACAA